MAQSELTARNYKRIFLINCLLCVPLMALFTWPYLKLAQLVSIHSIIAYGGALLFAFPFMLTILHGHVDLALGSVHRHHYYRWLENHPLTFGLLYHSAFVSTRFRLVIFAISAMIFLAGWLLPLG